MSKKKPDTRFEEHLWSISSSGTLYYATMPGQNRSRNTHLDAPTRLGRVLEVKYTVTSRHIVEDSGEKVGAFKLKVSPPRPAASASQSPIYAVNKWYVVVEDKFDSFDHVEHWQTPQSILDDYDFWSEYPKDTRVKDGRWLKNYFKTAEQKDDSGYGQRKRKRARVRTTDGKNKVAASWQATPPPRPPCMTSSANMQPGTSSAHNSATDSMTLSQDSLRPPPCPSRYHDLCLLVVYLRCV
jgi:hypothetical protein